MFFILQAIFTVLAVFSTLPFSIFLTASFFILKKILFGGLFLTCGLPTIAGMSTFWGVNKRQYTLFFQFLLPLICMVLFIWHPTARPAFLYSFYWFIPMLLYFVKNRNIFFAALNSTFVAHAVGSVMWLYATNMSTEKWLALIPVVAFERLIMTFGIVVFYIAINAILQIFQIVIIKPLVVPCPAKPCAEPESLSNHTSARILRQAQDERQ